MPSKKQQACVTRYVSAHYDKITLTVPKGSRDRYKSLAAQLGISVNQLFVQSVENYINKLAAPESCGNADFTELLNNSKVHKAE